MKHRAPRRLHTMPGPPSPLIVVLCLARLAALKTYPLSFLFSTSGPPIRAVTAEAACQSGKVWRAAGAGAGLTDSSRTNALEEGNRIGLAHRRCDCREAVGTSCHKRVHGTRSLNGASQYAMVRLSLHLAITQAKNHHCIAHA